MIENNNEPHILLVEDDQSQADLMMLGLRSDGGGFTIDHVVDGVEAMAYIRKQDSYAGAPTPDVVFLDLNLPRLSGLEVLEQVKADPNLQQIPVVILSTSENESDLMNAYARGVNSYVKKPVGFDRFQQMCKDLRQFWTVRNMSPRQQQEERKAA